MNEPSEEAKQAAEQCCEGLLGEDEMAFIIQQAIDTATAKLREDNERLRKTLRNLADIVYREGLSREEPEPAVE